MLLFSWRMAGYTLCCWLHGYSSKKSCENRTGRSWAYGKAFSIFCLWSVDMDCCSHCIFCFCIVLPYSTGYKCQNMPSVFACSHSVRLFGWHRVNNFLWLLHIHVDHAFSFEQSFSWKGIKRREYSYMHDDAIEVFYCLLCYIWNFIFSNFSLMLAIFIFFSGYHRVWRRSSIL